MAKAGKGVEAYPILPNPREAFRFLAAESVKRYRTDELTRLVAAHQKKDPGDPLLPFYQAEVYVRQQRYPLADKTFALALAGSVDAETVKSFRGSRVLARYHTGQTMSAYQNIGPRQETFAQLASLCYYDKDAGQLQALLEEHARSDPNGIDLLQYRYRLKFLQNQPAEGIALFKSLLSRPLLAKKRSELVNSFLYDVAGTGKVVEGYRVAPDAGHAYQVLAEQLLEDGRFEVLRQLNDAHRAGHPKDPWLAYFQGEVLLQDSAWDKAAQVLGDGIKQAPEDLRAGCAGGTSGPRTRQDAGSKRTRTPSRASRPLLSSWTSWSGTRKRRTLRI